MRNRPGHRQHDTSCPVSNLPNLKTPSNDNYPYYLFLEEKIVDCNCLDALRRHQSNSTQPDNLELYEQR